MRYLFVGSLLVATACNANLDKTRSTPAEAATAFAHSLSVIPVQVTVGDATGYVTVDTGDPLSILDGTYFDAVSAPAYTAGDDASLDLGATTIPHAFVINSWITNVSSGLFDFTFGNLGCSVTCAYAASFDYQNVDVALHEHMDQVTPPAGVGADQTVHFSLDGGHAMGLPVSRVIVPVTLDGVTYRMMVDTGATSVTVSAAAFTTLTSDGRTTAPNPTTTTSGTDDGKITRAHAVVVGGIEVDGPVVQHDSNFDKILANISADVGYTVDGSLGGTYLRNFFVTVDYPNSVLHLAPYDDTHWALDAGHRVGFTVAAPTVDGYAVTSVWGNAAAQGIKVGDNVIGIGGRDVFAFYNVLELQASLLGAVGTTRRIQLGNAATHDEDADLEVKIEERLPL